jgi:hypothetical protein
MCYPKLKSNLYQRVLLILTLLLLGLTLGACELETQATEAQDDLVGGPGTWIEYPPEGEIFTKGAIPITVYAAGQGGVSGISVSVGGEPVAVTELVSLTADNFLVRADLLWQPPGEGEYLIRASAGGTPASLRFCVVTCETSEDEDDGPTATWTATATPAPGEPTWTHTPTSTPTPYSDSSAEFWAAPPYINNGECTTLNWAVAGDFQAVYYEGTTVNASGSQQECPTESYTYQLQVQNMDGSTSDYWASVDVTQLSTDTPTPTQPTYTPSSAEFWAAPPYINSGECTTLNWNVYGDFQEVYFEGSPVNASGNDSECPAESYTYQLQIIEMDGSTTDHWASVDVSDPPLPADTSGPAINWTSLVFESCQFYGQAGISDESGVAWAQLYFNKNGEGWSSVWMQELSAEFWESEVGISVDDGIGTPIGTVDYYVVAADSLGNENESGVSTYSYTSCDG